MLIPDTSVQKPFNSPQQMRETIQLKPEAKLYTNIFIWTAYYSSSRKKSDTYTGWKKCKCISQIVQRNKEKTGFRAMASCIWQSDNYCNILLYRSCFLFAKGKRIEDAEQLKKELLEGVSWLNDHRNWYIACMSTGIMRLLPFLPGCLISFSGLLALT